MLKAGFTVHSALRAWADPAPPPHPENFLRNTGMNPLPIEKQMDTVSCLLCNNTTERKEKKTHCQFSTPTPTHPTLTECSGSTHEEVQHFGRSIIEKTPYRFCCCCCYSLIAL